MNDNDRGLDDILHSMIRYDKCGKCYNKSEFVCDFCNFNPTYEFIDTIIKTVREFKEEDEDEKQ